MRTSQLLASTAGTGTGEGRYSLLVAGEDGEVRAAQRLRHQVFAGELGAVLHSPEPGLDVDGFDAHCDHLVVRDDRTGQIVGTYRMLPPEGARSAGGLYCETEFAAPGLASLRTGLVEAGRSCVHPEHRTGAVVSLVWAGIARYMLLTGYRWLVGCASVPLRTPGAPDGAFAAGVWDTVRSRHLAPEQYRARPHRPWPPESGPPVSGPPESGPPESGPPESGPRPEVPTRGRAGLPPLLRGYLRLGAWVCGPPAYDPDFEVADFLVLLCLDRMDSRYLRHFLGEGV